MRVLDARSGYAALVTTGDGCQMRSCVTNAPARSFNGWDQLQGIVALARTTTNQTDRGWHP